MATWTIDPVHSSADLSVKHLGITPFRAGFREIGGTVEYDPANPAASSVSATIQSRSIDLRNEMFVGHVVGPDFLEADAYPEITFQSTGVTIDGNAWKVNGDLTIKGTTKPVVLDAEFLGEAKHPMAPRYYVAWTAKTQIKRSDFGITWNVPMEAGGFYVGDDLNVNLVIEASRPIEE